mmetsp:Transcript_11857/g.25263  ORF Transcript_11857/g.25263 Transcript_11857/m.25263 type:complete len:492 (+) Transcript_11857:176-1651(+)
MSPQQAANSYVSMATPIMSAKRPKKWNDVKQNDIPTLEVRDSMGRRDVQLQPTLSPTHVVMRVPKDCHQSCSNAVAPTDSDDCVGNSKVPTNTRPYSHIDNVFEEEDSPASASWVGRKVDALFSPVLSFLNGTVSVASNSQINAHDGLSSISNAMHNEESGYSVDEVKTMALGSVRQLDSELSLNKQRGSSKCVLNITEREATGSPFADVEGDVTLADCSKLPHALELRLSNNSHEVTSPVNEDKKSCKAISGSKCHTTECDEDSVDDAEDEFNPYLFIKCLPPYQRAIPSGWTSRPKALPPLDYTPLSPEPQICLVLDLDETLVHCTVEPVADADMIFPVEFNGMEYQVHVRCRPFLYEFLEAVSCKFEVVIFTASQQVYADKLLDKIDPDGKFITHRMFRDSCLPVEGNFLKDLSILGRDLSKAVLVDNSPHAFGYQVDNGIPIESWFDDPNDKELLKLEVFLRSLHGVEDVRSVVRETFHIQQSVLDA